mgnify:FL=1
MKKKRILKDPETGEIVGATRTPFSRKAKEMNEQIFAEKFEKSRLEKESQKTGAVKKNNLFLIVLAVLAVVAFVIWKGVGAEAEPSENPPANP